MLQVEEYGYEYNGTISEIKIVENYPTMIYFKSCPYQEFWWSYDKDLPEYIQVGRRVSIIYEEIIIKTYSHFWIEKFITADDLTEETRKRKNLSDLNEIAPYIRCNMCNELLYLNNFERCDGMITQYYCGIECNKCYAKNPKCDNRLVGKQCRQKSICCKKCHLFKYI